MSLFPACLEQQPVICFYEREYFFLLAVVKVTEVNTQTWISCKNMFVLSSLRKRLVIETLKCHCYYSTAVPSPMEGIRVLDMTRYLTRCKRIFKKNLVCYQQEEGFLKTLICLEAAIFSEHLQQVCIIFFYYTYAST